MFEFVEVVYKIPSTFAVFLDKTYTVSQKNETQLFGETVNKSIVSDSLVF